jgi:hypothetical protein
MVLFLQTMNLPASELAITNYAIFIEELEVQLLSFYRLNGLSSAHLNPDWWRDESSDAQQARIEQKELRIRKMGYLAWDGLDSNNGGTGDGLDWCWIGDPIIPSLPRTASPVNRL